MTGVIFRIRVTPLPHVTDPIRALRAALKALLRRFGLRAIDVVQEDVPKASAPGGIRQIGHKGAPSDNIER